MQKNEVQSSKINAALNPAVYLLFLSIFRPKPVHLHPLKRILIRRA